MYQFLMFILMMLLWVLMSGKFDLFHLSLGAISSALVGWVSNDLLFQDREKSVGCRLVEAGRFVTYAVWLVWQIMLANMHVVRLAFAVKPIKEVLQPSIITFKTTLKSDFARFVLANSITLTPGTVTIRVFQDMFHVHAISEKALGDLADDAIPEMERRIRHVFEARENKVNN